MLNGDPERIRLISPTRRRIWQPTVERLVNDTEAVQHAAQTLIVNGYRVYEGPARTDLRGWVIPDTDPELIPLTPAIAYGPLAKAAGR